MYICIYIFLITGQELLLNSVELNTRKVDNHIDNFAFKANSNSLNYRPL